MTLSKLEYFVNKLESNFHQFQYNYNSVTWLVQTPTRYANFRMVGVLVLSKLPAKEKKNVKDAGLIYGHKSQNTSLRRSRRTTDT